MIPFDWQYANWWIGTAICSGSLWYAYTYYERRRNLRNAEIVRTKIVTQKCAACGSELADWDGVFHSGDIHFNPGGYLPLLIVPCKSCQTLNYLYCVYCQTFDDCSLVNHPHRQ